MKVIAYVSSVSDEAPEHLRCIAQIVHADGSVHPVIFRGSSKQAVREAAQAWWDAEIARMAKAEETRAETARKIAATRDARKAPAAQVAA